MISYTVYRSYATMAEANRHCRHLFKVLEHYFSSVDVTPSMEDQNATIEVLLHATDTEANRNKAENIFLQMGFTTAPGDESTTKAFCPPILSGATFLKYFHHLYEVGPYIRLIHDATCAKQHVLLYGEPGCAKTQLFLAFTKWYGKSNVLALDAPTLTKAGLENQLLKTRRPILYIEEIEKCATPVRSVLLQVMDDRKKVQKTLASGDRVFSVDMVVWATCNDLEKLHKAASGALLSRFAGMVFECRRPTSETLYKIIYTRAIEKGLSQAHADKVFDFMVNNLHSTDARLAVSLLAGGDRLLGNYLKDWSSCHAS